MHSFRRAALRAAVSTTVAATAKPQVSSSFASHINLSSVRRAVAPVTFIGSRYFSQTLQRAQEDDAATKAAQEAAQNVGTSTVAENNTVEQATDAADGLTPESAAGYEASTRLYVSNFVFEVTPEAIREEFSKYGQVVDVSMPHDRSGRNRGFAFVRYISPEVAAQARDKAHQSFWFGRRINVAAAKPRPTVPSRKDSHFGPSREELMARPQGARTSALYIGNIPYETKDKELNAIFEGLENCVDVRVAVDRNTGWPRGFAHADFTDADSAEKALELLRTKKVGQRYLRVDFAVEKPKRPSPREHQQF